MLHKPLGKRAVVFHDPNYPQPCSEETLHTLIPGEFHLVEASHLAEALTQDCNILISFHGPYFPKSAWAAILRFLEAGGNLALFGGMPFTRPVTEQGTIEPEQQAYTDQMHLGPFFPLALPATDLSLVASREATFLESCPLSLPSAQPGRFWSCYPQMTQASDHPEDLGSAGPLDTLLTPLLFVNTPSSPAPLATPAALFDQQHGRFKGGRWLVSAWQPSSEDAWLANTSAIRQLIQLAAEGCAVLDVYPALACYQTGEQPELKIAARTPHDLRVSIKVSTPRGELLAAFETELAGSPFLQEVRKQLPVASEPGLYNIEACYARGVSLRQQSGFWLWDGALVETTRNARLTAGRDYFYQQGEPFPICGTTYMDSRVQRKFLYLPNPARWDLDFAAMKEGGINLIRTGIWTAWRELMPVAGFAQEAALRTLDAFVMTACKHQVQVIFTFFSFFPPLFEGQNPWLDPRSIEGQLDFVTMLARRYRNVELVSWDLINEPSFGDPARIFAQRPLPNHDPYERIAFQRWLRERYTLSELQLRWRQTPADLPSWDQVTLPADADYSTYVGDTGKRNMLKVMDYTRFSQEMFAQWASTMYAAIRATGCQTLIGVGQDEAGARIAPQFYAPAVDYTTTHPWWKNDDLLWDMLLDKTFSKPNLIQETGIMLVRSVDMRPWRSEQACADLLERKLITGLIARGAGLVQWLWHINPYMTTQNENSIGLVRADGSAKPELNVMLEFGRLVQSLDTRLVEAATPPEVWVVIPYSQWFLRPDLAIESTRRAIRVLGYDFGVIPQMVAEQQLAELARAQHRPACIILPGVQTFEREALRALCAFAQAGTTVLISGTLSLDPHYLSETIDLIEQNDDLSPVPVSRYEHLERAFGEKLQLLFDHEKIAYVSKAHNQLKEYQLGDGRLVWSGLPLELSSNPSVVRTIYQGVLNRRARQLDQDSSLLVVRRTLVRGSLVLAVSESSSEQRVQLDDGQVIAIASNRAGAVVFKEDQCAETFGGVSLLKS